MPDGDDQNNPRLIEAHDVNSFTVYDVDLINAPLFHIYFEGGNGLTMWGVRIKTPATARNTDGIDPDSSTDVTVNDSYIQDGDDGVVPFVSVSAFTVILCRSSQRSQSLKVPVTTNSLFPCMWL